MTVQSAAPSEARLLFLGFREPPPWVPDSPTPDSPTPDSGRYPESGKRKQVASNALTRISREVEMPTQGTAGKWRPYCAYCKNICTVVVNDYGFDLKDLGGVSHTTTTVRKAAAVTPRSSRRTRPVHAAIAICAPTPSLSSGPTVFCSAKTATTASHWTRDPSAMTQRERDAGLTAAIQDGIAHGHTRDHIATALGPSLDEAQRLQDLPEEGP